ncbi:MAG: hypothetical protein IKB89_02420, partial [Clostridia bacterium]|nr:hypothetical protein [Clostridia bacterium]
MKKVISGMLALVMMLCIMSVSVMAAEYVLDGGFEGYASNWTTTRDALKNYGTENLYCNSNVGTLAIDTVNVKTGSQSLKMVAGKAAQATYDLYTNLFDVEKETYTVKVDVFPKVEYNAADGVDYSRVRIGFSERSADVYEHSTTAWANSKVNGTATEWNSMKSTGDYVDFNVPVNAWTSLEVEYTPTAAVETALFQIIVVGHNKSASRDTAIGDVVMYVDNISVTEKPAVVEPEVFDVTGTTNNEAYGTVAASAATSAGEAVTFTVTPKLGYYVAAATLNGESVLGSFDAYEGGTYTVAEVAEDVTLAVEFAAVAAKGENVATLTDSFVAADNAVTFGKVLDTTDATSWGIELKKDGVGVTPYHGGSYLYKA